MFTKDFLTASFTISITLFGIAAFTGNPVLFGISIGLNVINVAICIYSNLT